MHLGSSALSRARCGQGSFYPRGFRGGRSSPARRSLLSHQKSCQWIPTSTAFPPCRVQAGSCREVGRCTLGFPVPLTARRVLAGLPCPSSRWVTACVPRQPSAQAVTSHLQKGTGYYQALGPAFPH